MIFYLIRMKPKAILLIFLIIAIGSNAQDEASLDSSNYKNEFKFSPVEFFSSTFQLCYERSLKPGKSVAFISGLIYDKDWYGDERTGFKAEVQYRYSLFTSIGKKTTKNLFFAPFLMYKYVNGYTEYWEENYQGYHYYKAREIINTAFGGVMFGLKWQFLDRLVIDIYFGGGFRYSDNDLNYEGIGDPSYTGIAPKGGIDIGFLF